MTDLIIDAPLLACPDPAQFDLDDFQQNFRDFLSRLADLSTLREAVKSIRFWRDEELSLVLHGQGCFPFRHSLAKAFQHLHDQTEFQLEDANVLATALLERSLGLEDAGSIKDIVVSNCLVGDDPVQNRSAMFRDHLCRALALALPVLGNGNEFASNTFVASCGSSASSAFLSATYTVEMVETADGSCTECDDTRTVSVANYRGLDRFLEDADPLTWWSSSAEQGLVDVCAIAAALGNANDRCATMRRVHHVLTVGREFMSSARTLGFMHDPSKIGRLLRVCADLLLDRNLASSHWLRVGRGGNEPQKVRDEWRAWRHDIDYEFHLHYWRMGDRIELANVVVHNDFDITR